MFNLEEIQDPTFLKNLSKKELKILCDDIRKFLIENISKTGGHLASNLGMVEISVGLHYVFNNECDKFIFDVGHQSYVHKILTGRAKDFKTLRKFNGLSGFINYDESKYDCFESGHSSTSISAQAGFLLAKSAGEPIGDVISIIGDSSISNGVAFEGLCFLPTIKNQRPIILINDNKMGISKSVGAMTRVFDNLRGTRAWRGFKKTLNMVLPKFVINKFHQIKRGFKATIQHENIFEDMGYDYYGPYDGNNIYDVIKELERAKASKDACIIHFVTKKGMGYKYSEEDEYGAYHGVEPFDIKTGKPLLEMPSDMISYSEGVASILCNLRMNHKFFVISPAMIVGSKLKMFQEKFPNSIFDVGIAEEHAAVMSSALALNQQKVILLMYSTFAQRSYDEILNDIARRNIGVIIGIDRAGLVPSDGSTHQGIYDISMFYSMPNVMICQGKDLNETSMLFKFALFNNQPIVIRYSKEMVLNYVSNDRIIDTSWTEIHKGNKLIIVSYGTDINEINELIIKNNLDVRLINARFIRPVDKNMISSFCNKKVLVYEQVVSHGGLYDAIARTNKNIELYQMAIGNNTYVPQGDIKNLKEYLHISMDDLLKKVKELCD